MIFWCDFKCAKFLRKLTKFFRKLKKFLSSTKHTIKWFVCWTESRGDSRNSWDPNRCFSALLQWSSPIDCLLAVWIHQIRREVRIYTLEYNCFLFIVYSMNCFVPKFRTSSNHHNSGTHNIGGQSNSSLHARFHVRNLIPLDKAAFSSRSTCFQATLSIQNTDLSDQRDYTLVVENDQGTMQSVVKLKVFSIVYWHFRYLFDYFFCIFSLFFHYFYVIFLWLVYKLLWHSLMSSILLMISV